MGLELSKFQALLLKMKEEGRSVEKLDTRFASYFNSGKEAHVHFPDGKIAYGRVECRLYEAKWPMFTLSVLNQLTHTADMSGSGTEISYLHLWLDSKCKILPTMEELDEVVNLGDQTDADWGAIDDNPKKAFWQSITSGRMAMMKALGGTIPENLEQLVDEFVKESVSRGMTGLGDLPKNSLLGLWNAFQHKKTGTSVGWVTPKVAPFYNRVKSSGATNTPEPEFVYALIEYCQTCGMGSRDLSFSWLRSVYDEWRTSDSDDVDEVAGSLFLTHILLAKPTPLGEGTYNLEYRWRDSLGHIREYTWNISLRHYELWQRCQYLLGMPDVPTPVDLMDLITYSVQSVDTESLLVTGFSVPELIDRWLKWKGEVAKAVESGASLHTEWYDCTQDYDGYDNVAFHRRPKVKIDGPYEVAVSYVVEGVMKLSSVFVDRRVLTLFYWAMFRDVYRMDIHPVKFLNWCRLVVNNLGPGISNYAAIPKGVLEKWLAEFDIGGTFFQMVQSYAKGWLGGGVNPSNPFPGDAGGTSSGWSWVLGAKPWVWKPALDWVPSAPGDDREVRLNRGDNKLWMYSQSLADWYDASVLNGFDVLKEKAFSTFVVPPKDTITSAINKEIFKKTAVPAEYFPPNYVPPGKISGSLEVQGVKADFVAIDYGPSFEQDEPEHEQEPPPKKGRLIDL